MSKIEWTDLTWNPVTGCDKVSQGCKNCYAEKMHKRLLAIAPHKYTKPFLGNIELHPDELRKPIDKKKPTMWFVNSMSDLFHDDVPFEFINEVFTVINRCPQHIFQILTKRPDRMLKYLRDYKSSGWPLKNVLLGTSAENQDCYNKRIAPMWFVRKLGWRTMLSCEPLIGPIRLFIAPGDLAEDTFSWIIVGGESGPKARPMHPEWVRSLRNQCAASEVPFFFKQWGSWTFLANQKHAMEDDEIVLISTGEEVIMTACSSASIMKKVGKSKSGNFLDGELHLEFPSVI